MSELTVTTTDGHFLGLIDGSVDAATNEFCVALADGAVCQLDDLVCSSQKLADGRTLEHFGIITELRARIEGAGWASDSAAIASGTLPGQPVRVATVRVLRTVPELWMTPQPAAETHAAVGEKRELALFCDQMDAKFPVGVDQTGQPVWADWRFVNGEQGGHISITGVSGVATKTSYATFLLYLLFESKQGRALLGSQAASTRAVVFNVKGEDLLMLDRPNNKLDAHEGARQMWAALGVDDPGPFTSIEFFTPATVHEGQVTPDCVSRPADTVTAFGWTPKQFISKGLLRFCFTSEDERRTQVWMVADRVKVQLARWAYPVVGKPGAVVLCEPPDGTTHNFDRLIAQTRTPRPAGDGILIENFSDLVDAVVGFVDQEHADWVGRISEATLTAFARRLMALQPRLGNLVDYRLSSLSLDRHISVVDIHGLPDAAQRFAVGAILDEIYTSKQGEGREPLRIVVLDELNKFAPRSGHSPIGEILVDIAERGRSLGVLLWGAQQSAMSIEEAIFRNAAIKVAGRLDASEAGDYKFLTGEMRQRATRFLPGTMVFDQPLIPAPLPIRFPFPSYASSITEGRQQMTDGELGDAMQGL